QLQADQFSSLGYEELLLGQPTQPLANTSLTNPSLVNPPHPLANTPHPETSQQQPLTNFDELQFLTPQLDPFEAPQSLGPSFVQDDTLSIDIGSFLSIPNLDDDSYL